jgi:putative ABC transport system permease protein
LTLNQHLHQAVSNIFGAKLRSFLALLGILVGTGSVVALIISGQLATEKALSQFKALGTDLLAISLYEKKTNNSVSPKNTIKMDQWLTLPAKIPAVKEIAPYTTMYAPIAFLGHKIDGSIIGADESLSKVIKIKVEKGNFVSYLDKYEKFCVIGHKIKEQLREYTQGPLIGRQIWLGANIYTIIGIADKWTENAFFNEDVNKAIFIPVRGSSLVSANIKINNVIFRLKPNIDIDKLTEEVKLFIETESNNLNMFPRSAKQIIKSMEAQGKIFTLLLGLIGGISLLVGGIGVMNVMLVSVVERKKEIGIRRAIGARARDIQQLFLIESVVLSVFGGVLGVIIGLLVAYIISYVSHWPFMFFWQPPVIGFLVSVGTGIFFGFYPAWRAAKLNPIETLRSD